MQEITAEKQDEKKEMDAEEWSDEEATPRPLPSTLFFGVRGTQANPSLPVRNKLLQSLNPLLFCSNSSMLCWVSGDFTCLPSWSFDFIRFLQAQSCRSSNLTKPNAQESAMVTLRVVQ